VGSWRTVALGSDDLKPVYVAGSPNPKGVNAETAAVCCPIEFDARVLEDIAFLLDLKRSNVLKQDPFAK
jgi:hypothetical protein